MSSVSVARAIDDTGTPGTPLEHAWNDGTAYGAGGGGISNAWTMPAWQRDARVPGIALPGSTAYRDADRLEAQTGYPLGFCQSATRGEGTACRLVPDVSAQADEFTGGVTVYSRADRSDHHRSGWTTTGGTSSAAPIWAASLALVNASPTCSQSNRTRAGVGFAAPLLYGVASDPASYAASFTDVRTGDNDVYGLDDGRVFRAGRGYDLATGLGSPQLTQADGAPGLASYLCAAAAAGSAPSVRSLSPAQGSASGGARLLVHGNGFAAAGRSRVASVQVGTRRIDARAIQVRGPHTLALRLPSAAAATPPDTSDAERGYRAGRRHRDPRRRSVEHRWPALDLPLCRPAGAGHPSERRDAGPVRWSRARRHHGDDPGGRLPRRHGSHLRRSARLTRARP